MMKVRKRDVPVVRNYDKICLDSPLGKQPSIRSYNEGRDHDLKKDKHCRNMINYEKIDMGSNSMLGDIEKYRFEPMSRFLITYDTLSNMSERDATHSEISSVRCAGQEFDDERINLEQVCKKFEKEKKKFFEKDTRDSVKMNPALSIVMKRRRAKMMSKKGDKKMGQKCDTKEKKKINEKETKGKKRFSLFGMRKKDKSKSKEKGETKKKKGTMSRIKRKVSSVKNWLYSKRKELGTGFLMFLFYAGVHIVVLAIILCVFLVLIL